MLRAARFQGVDPWDLAERPVEWRDWILIVQGAEAQAQAIAQQRAEAARKRTRFGEMARHKRAAFAGRSNRPRTRAKGGNT